MSKSELALSVRHLSKTYLISRNREKYTRLGEKLMAKLRNPISRSQMDSFNALQDVSFDVKRGEVVGIVGRNGAGKSTLLKILSRITEPTAGEIKLYGRVASLLEVGTGFHPELTGRENIFLNGAILGMTKAEIRRQFDAIVEFSEVENFLDMPVKRYSSGMYVRLAFSVAAHLNPEILIVDEVLAVGDVAFQAKCLGKIKEVTEGGDRTVLFVSHNMAALRNLCTAGILLLDGKVETRGEIEKVLCAYLANVESGASADLSLRSDRRGRGRVKLVACTALGGDSRDSYPHVGGSLVLRFELSASVAANVVFTIYDSTGVALCNFNSGNHSPLDSGSGSPSRTVECILEEVLLVPGRYRVNTAIYHGVDLEDHLEGAAVFDIERGALRQRPINDSTAFGQIAHPHRWKFEVEDSLGS